MVGMFRLITGKMNDDGFKLVMTSSDTTTHVNNDFGNWREGTKSGIKFEDENADGDQDAEDLPLDGWVIRAYADDGALPGNGIIELDEYNAGPAGSSDWRQTWRRKLTGT